MATIQKCEIKDLSIDAPAVFITCLLIAKTEPRQFESKYDGIRKSVITLTVRDSKRHIINCTVWGSDHFVDNCNLGFRIGDIITINRPKILPNNGSQFMPLTTVPFSLSLREGTSFIFRESTEPYTELNSLFHESIKPTSHAIYLADLMNGMSNSTDDYVDLLVLVRVINPTRTINTKHGEKLVREIYVMDSTNKAVLLTLWNNEYIQRANDWRPLQTVLHLVDARKTYSDFHKTIVLTMNARTIITEDPVQSSKSKNLMEFICGLSQEKLTDLSTLEKRNSSLINLEDINTVMTVQKIIGLRDKIDEPEDQFTALIYAVITNFDIGMGFDPISRYCVLCNKILIRSNSGSCENEICKAKFETENIVERELKKFNIAISVSDGTGTLNCRLTDQYAANVLKCSVAEFSHFDEKTIDELREKYLLARFSMKLLIKRKTMLRKAGFLMVLDIFETDPEEVAANIKCY